MIWFVLIFVFLIIEAMSLNLITIWFAFGSLCAFISMYFTENIVIQLIVFTISMITLEATGITNKYNKLCTLVSAIIMIIMGLLLILKPEWIMFNF